MSAFDKGKAERDEALKGIGTAVQIAVQPLLGWAIPDDKLVHITQLVANDAAQYIYKNRYGWTYFCVVVKTTENKPGDVAITITFERTDT